jgi:hypothetical protein
VDVKLTPVKADHDSPWEIAKRESEREQAEADRVVVLGAVIMAVPIIAFCILLGWYFWVTKKPCGDA